MLKWKGDVRQIETERSQYMETKAITYSYSGRGHRNKSIGIYYQQGEEVNEDTKCHSFYSISAISSGLIEKIDEDYVLSLIPIV